MQEIKTTGPVSTADSADTVKSSEDYKEAGKDENKKKGNLYNMSMCPLSMCVCLCVPNKLLNHAPQTDQTLREGVNNSRQGHC